MRRLLMILFLAAALAGCSYKFFPDDLKSVDYHQPTGLKDWQGGEFEKDISRNFTYADTAARNITDIVNSHGFQLGLIKRNDSCDMTGISPGYADLVYQTGTIVIEQDICDPNSSGNIAYDEIGDVLKSSS
jgi:hypothetical protein